MTFPLRWKNHVTFRIEERTSRVLSLRLVSVYRYNKQIKQQCMHFLKVCNFHYNFLKHKNHCKLSEQNMNFTSSGIHPPSGLRHNLLLIQGVPIVSDLTTPPSIVHSDTSIVL